MGRLDLHQMGQTLVQALTCYFLRISEKIDNLILDPARCTSHHLYWNQHVKEDNGLRKLLPIKYCRTGIFRKRVFFGIFGISVKIPKITIFRIFSKNFQPYGFFTAQLRTHELLVNNKGNHNESRFGVVA